MQAETAVKQPAPANPGENREANLRERLRAAQNEWRAALDFHRYLLDRESNESRARGGSAAAQAAFKEQVEARKEYQKALRAFTSFVLLAKTTAEEPQSAPCLHSTIR